MPAANNPLPLRDIIAPLEPGWWPPAPGWWLVAAISLLFLGWLLRFLVAKFTYKYASLRKAALRELDALQVQPTAGDTQFAEQIFALLKRVAMVRYADRKPASLSGNAWLAFLDQTAPGSLFSEAGGSMLFDAQYQTTANIDRDSLLAAARHWVKAI